MITRYYRKTSMSRIIQYTQTSKQTDQRQTHRATPVKGLFNQQREYIPNFRVELTHHCQSSISPEKTRVHLRNSASLKIIMIECDF